MPFFRGTKKCFLSTGCRQHSETYLREIQIDRIALSLYTYLFDDTYVQITGLRKLDFRMLVLANRFNLPIDVVK